MSGFYLLDHPNPHGPNYYATRRGSILAAVVHITAGLQGRPAGADSSAEATAAYAASTARDVSWHSGSDRDSSLQLLPDSYTAWQCHGYNSRTIGHEISKTDVTWADEDPDWVTGTLTEAADCLRPRLDKLNIPIRRATKDELDRAIARNGMPVGLIGHQVLDPTRRRDPGADFPWTRFLQLLRGKVTAPSKPPAPAPHPAPEPVPEDHPMPVISKDPSGPAQYVHDYVRGRHITDPAELNELIKAGLKRDDSLSTKTLAAIMANR